MDTQIVDNTAITLIKAITSELKWASQAFIAIAYITDNDMTRELLKAIRKSSCSTMFVIGTGFAISESAIIGDIAKEHKCRMTFSDSMGLDSSFHPKVYLFESKQKASAIVGSSNFTQGGLRANQEVNLHISWNKGAEDTHVYETLKSDVFMRYWNDAIPPTSEVLREYGRLEEERKRDETSSARKHEPSFKQLAGKISFAHRVGNDRFDRLTRKVWEIRRDDLPRKRIETRRLLEAQAAKLLSENIGRLTPSIISKVAEKINGDWWDGEATSGRFGQLFRGQTMNWIEETARAKNRALNRFLYGIYVYEDLDKVEDRWSDLKGVNQGFVSSVLYLKDKDRYNYYMPDIEKGLLKASKIGSLTGTFKEKYLRFNKLANEFKESQGLEPEEVDVVLTVLGKESSVLP